MKVTVAENEEKTKQKTNKNKDFIYSLCLYFSVSQQY